MGQDKNEVDFIKAPDAELDYSIDWTKGLDGTESIISSTWTVPTGLTSTSEAFTNDRTAIYLSGGTVGVTYTVLNEVTTDSATPRTDSRIIMFFIQEKRVVNLC